MKLTLPGLALALALSTTIAKADDINVTYAGSMGVVMDKALGPEFARENNVTYQGQGKGAYAMARLIAAHKVPSDVFVSITPGPMDILKQAGLIDQAEPVASTSMVIAYNPKGKFGEAFAQAAKNTSGQPQWWQVLGAPGLKFGRTDPVGDPQGQNIIFTLKLADKYYNQPGYADKVLGPILNTDQVFIEGNLLTRLEAGQIDASSGYKSAVISAHLPYIELPAEINLSDPDYAQKWYDTVSFEVTGADGKNQTFHPQPLVFYAAVLKNAANKPAAEKFIAFLKSEAGQKLLSENGYDAPKGHALYP